jgi:hypothetical protein
VTDPVGPEDLNPGIGNPDTSTPRADTDAGEPARPVDRFRRTAVGSVVTAGLFGLRDALEGRPEREQTAVVSEARIPDDNGTLEVVLDFERPGHGIVVIHREQLGDDTE